MPQKNRSGFTIIEIVISIGVLMLVSATFLFILNNQSIGNLESDAQIIASRLSSAQTRAISASNGSGWGIYFSNITSSAPWYALFQGTNFISSTEMYYLTSSVGFQTPASGTSTTIAFTKLTGRISTSTSIVIQLRSNSAETKIINVTPEGSVSVQ